MFTCEIFPLLSVISTLFCCETDGDPEILKENLQRLPVSLAESVEALEKDTLFRDMIGEKLLVAIKGVRKVRCKGLHIYIAMLGRTASADKNFQDNEIKNDCDSSALAQM